MFDPWVRSPGGGLGTPLPYSCLENPVDRGAWWAIVHRVAESDMTEATEHAYMLDAFQRESIVFISPFLLTSYSTLSKILNSSDGT